MSFGFEPETEAPKGQSSAAEQLPTASRAIDPTGVLQLAEAQSVPPVVVTTLAQESETASPIAADFQDMLTKPKPRSFLGWAAPSLVVAMVAIVFVASRFMHTSNGPGSQTGSASQLTGQTTGSSESRKSVATASPPPFPYLAPDSSSGWKYNKDQLAYDARTGVSKYTVTLVSDSATVTISQQQMPPKLRARDGLDFQQLTRDSKATRQLDIPGGGLYLVPAYSGPGSISGSAIVIMATDSVLLFGRSDKVIPEASWSKLLSAMTLVRP
jgi:hypothetical protein